MTLTLSPTRPSPQPPPTTTRQDSPLSNPTGQLKLIVQELLTPSIVLTAEPNTSVVLSIEASNTNEATVDLDSVTHLRIGTRHKRLQQPVSMM